jgi:hypothetical protein
MYLMADYFTDFSFILPLANEVQQEYALNLAHSASRHRFGEEPLPADFPASLADVLEDWQFESEADDDGIWLHSESGGIDAVCAFVQHLLEKFNPSGRIAFEWSHDCSRPRVDAYGGGAAIITASEIKTMNTADWLTDNA